MHGRDVAEVYTASFGAYAARILAFEPSVSAQQPTRSMQQTTVRAPHAEHIEGARPFQDALETRSLAIAATRHVGGRCSDAGVLL